MYSGLLLSRDEGRLSSVTRIQLDGIMLRQARQRKTNTVGFHLYVDSEKKKAKLIKTGNRMVVTRGWGGWGGRFGEMLFKGINLQPVDQ